MSHLVILPVVLPTLFAVLLLLPMLDARRAMLRLCSVGMMFVTAIASSILVWQQTNVPAQSYLLGDWAEPFGILLVADQLSALLVWLTSVLAFLVSLFSLGGDDEKGAYFHPLLHFLLMGLNGAFLTGDLFNLFVFFEVLLIASYSLLVHGGGKKRIQAALHYVLLNLLGSALFLLALALLYALLGTLHMAEMAARIQQLDAQQYWLLQSAGGLLLIVFGLKAALLPLHFWLPAAYSHANASVGAMFAVMTKVGVYSFIRVFGLLFGAQAGPLTGYGLTLLWWGGLATMLLAGVLLLAAVDVKKIAAALVLLSAGTLLAAVGLANPTVTAAALLYLLHSCWIGALWFMLAELIARARGGVADRLIPGPKMANIALAVLFFFSAMMVIGFPPFSGFIAKVWLIQAALPVANGGLYVACLLICSLVLVIALSRAGSTLFWRHNGKAIEVPAASIAATSGAWGLLLAGFALVLAAPWLMQFSVDAVAQLTQQLKLGGLR